MELVYRLYTIKPMRMLLFGAVPPLVLIALYLIIWEYAFTLDQKTNYRDFFDLTIWLLIALAGFFAYLGFRYSGYYTEIRMDNAQITIKKIPKFKLFGTFTKSAPWKDIKNYTLYSDSKGNVLKIYLKNRDKPIVLAQAHVFEPDIVFLKFYASFEEYMRPYTLD